MNKKNLPQRDRFALLLRAKEIRIVTGLIGKSRKIILEIGGNNGWQAHLIEKKGHNLSSIDISPINDNSSFFSVLEYDGHNIPYKDSSFDIVFSSNVLEHIPHLDSFEKEIHRVLKPTGQAIHVLPTSTWRIWTSLTHPFRVLLALKNKLHNINRTNKSGNTNNSTSNKWKYILWPNRHGEKGNSLTEIYWFSQTAWTRHFKKTGWCINNIISTSLFYTGQTTLNRRLSIKVRKRIAIFLGSATKIYVLNSTQTPDNSKINTQTIHNTK